ncbi:uncharacterized protein EURHEDRAFT_107346 [Aspergillus ruber CBS 135680]|uniref:Uncharacterized protein n=1 Tax=Aspergillus ruber (strain CBS 135680) TaxID=1388766 RepID=A0A017SBW7_ASPRC|nr:uncharacterized protein EURHEDRAFT_107346 [Aspergillus ruber CBS 135680]EYE94109.1 hypothetical protein EURHEDRAFT_107346 [Aspergillus ruber CBS 135680]
MTGNGSKAARLFFHFSTFLIQEAQWVYGKIESENFIASGPDGRSASQMRQSVTFGSRGSPTSPTGVRYCTRIVGGHRIDWRNSMTPRDGGMTAPMADVELWQLTETRDIHSRIRTPESGQPQHDLICPRHGLRQTKTTCDGYESSAQAVLYKHYQGLGDDC